MWALFSFSCRLVCGGTNSQCSICQDCSQPPLLTPHTHECAGYSTHSPHRLYTALMPLCPPLHLHAGHGQQTTDVCYVLHDPDLAANIGCPRVRANMDVHRAPQPRARAGMPAALRPSRASSRAWNGVSSRQPFRVSAYASLALLTPVAYLSRRVTVAAVRALKSSLRTKAGGGG